MPDTICIVTQSHLCRNPRVLKEAVTLANRGYNVHIVTSIFSKELLQQDNAAINGHNIRLHIINDNSQKNLSSIAAKLITRLNRWLVKYFNSQNAAALGYGFNKYLKTCLALNASLYICHQELATCIGTKLIAQGRKVAFDLEDWYSEDLLPEARNNRPIALLKKAEYIAINDGVYCTTASAALAKKLAEAYTGKPPAVIYNVFPSPILPRVNKTYTSPIKLFWFSQTIGPGRGLEQFISLLANIKNDMELHLLGAVNDTYKNTLNKLLASRHAIHFHPLVSEPQLAQKIAGFDVGLALELDNSLSRNYTITNKFFQYIQSGLPVIATETAGQAEAFEKYQPGLMLSQKPDSAIIALENWLNDPEEIIKAGIRAQEAAKFYNWENESKKLIYLVEGALK